ncbi:MAG: hypothetical protein E7349_04970 [Clostridiales bacterium]|nr:hypothetical protein [Clostridiales bacterium]
MAFFTFRERFSVEGIMPERALARLKRAGICIYNAKKVKKNQILFSVSRKDSEKVFAIYPNVCYNISVYTPFVVKKVGAEGIARYVELMKKRAGLLLGGLLFAAAIVASDSLIFGIQFVNSSVYERETLMALEESGIKPFAPYNDKDLDVACSKILSLDGVEYCSVRKTGFWAQVELRFSPFTLNRFEKDSMKAKHTGTLLSLTALKGTPVKKIGDEIQVNDVLVENYFSLESGGQVCVEPIARASIACCYEAVLEANSEEEAFAMAYLELGLSDLDTITAKEITGADCLYTVKIGYIVIERINM